tara:strand:+ start:344 stop:1066 length:723 start_codon:yes stop_codon:yes gene_type:complete
MHFVFLAAGKGKRIYRNIKTNKCLIKINNKTIIESLIENIPKSKRNKITIVTGFNSNKIIKKTKKYKVNYIHNSKFQTTEMVETLKIALKKINEDILFSYSDILYTKEIISKIQKNNNNKILVPININWRQIWKIRNKAVFNDAESLIINKNRILEIGNKIKNIEKVQGQFMGLLFIPKLLRETILKLLNNKKFKKFQTTKLLNYLIKKGFFISAIRSKSHWYEFDDLDDLNNYRKHFKN